jgi:hypothetical protein
MGWVFVAVGTAGLGWLGLAWAMGRDRGGEMRNTGVRKIEISLLKKQSSRGHTW